jgi:D-sedoheptulose 7-phosphate isomerase/D-glycero-D-manno-heptose 1,7-bisphosphate phosphatase
VSGPGVLLDRDGTIIADHGYVGSVDRVEFLDGAIEAIAALNRAHLPVAVVTNQAGVARGYFDLEDVHQVHKHMIEEMARQGAHVDLWLFCPYHPDGTVESFARASADRKPGPGMALAAGDALDLDLTSSWVVGDSAGDIGLARAVGARPLHVGPVDFPDADVLSFPDLAAAARHIVDSQTGNGPTVRPSFPTRQYPDGGTFGSAYAGELAKAFSTIDMVQLARAAEFLNDAYDRGASVFACGNGGSASIANHLQCDHVKGVRNGTDLTTRVFSLCTNMEIFSAIGNDSGTRRCSSISCSRWPGPGMC